MAPIVPLMSRFLLRGRVLTPERDLPLATVLVVDNMIDIVSEGVVEPEAENSSIEAGDIIVPGFIDLQVNGFAGSEDRKSTRLNSSHRTISYAVFCLKKK